MTDPTTTRLVAALLAASPDHRIALLSALDTCALRAIIDESEGAPGDLWDQLAHAAHTEIQNRWRATLVDDTDDEQPDDPDRADDVHEVLAALSPARRAAGAALLELPAEHVIALYRDSPGGDVIEGLTAGAAFVHLATAAITPEKVLDLLHAQRLVRPGLDGAQ